MLRRGGEEIAQAKGELGQLLYSGATGLAGYAALLKEAAAQVEAFHKRRGRSTTLAETKTRLKELDATLAAARLDPRRFEALRRDLDACDRSCADADAARDDARRALALRELPIPAARLHAKSLMPIRPLRPSATDPTCRPTR